METNFPLPAVIDIPVEPAKFIAGYRHLSKVRSIILWITLGLGSFELINFLVSNILIFRTFLFRAPVVAERSLMFGIFLCAYAIILLVTTKKRITATGTAQSRLCGGWVHYEITEEGMMSAAADGYSFRNFSVLYKVFSYPDMWIIYFGDSAARTAVFFFKTAFPDPDGQKAFEAFLTQKLNGRQIIYKS